MKCERQKVVSASTTVAAASAPCVLFFFHVLFPKGEKEKVNMAALSALSSRRGQAWGAIPSEELPPWKATNCDLKKMSP